MEILGNIDVYRIFAENVSRFRRARKWHQHDLAAMSEHLSVDKIRAYEQRRRFPGADEMQALANALGVDPAALITPQSTSPPPLMPVLPPDILDALNRCTPENWDVLRTVLRGLGKLTQSPSQSGKAPSKERA